jgi:hypothetical protein
MSKKKKDLPLDAQDGEKCANCDVRYERPHWEPVLCDKCFKAYLDKGEKPPFNKASGVEL